MRIRAGSATLSLLALIAVDPHPADASCIPGFDHAIFAKNTIHIQGNAGTNSYDSAVGTYAATNSCASAHIGTNGVGNGNIHVQSNATNVCGNVYVGAGGSPASVVTGNGNILGTKSAQATNMSLPNVTFPALAAAAIPSQAFNNTNGVLAPNFTYNAISCKNGSLTLSAGKYIVSSLTLTSNCQLKMGTGPIEVYFSGFLDLKSGAVMNTTQKPSNMMFYGGSGATTVSLQGGVDASFAVYAPSADCSLQGNADLWGAMVCNNAHVQGNAHVHYDRALGNFAGGGFTCPVKEISRATPIVADISGTSTIVQGTFELPVGSKTSISVVGDIASFSFPYIKGHMRARTLASISSSGSTFSSGTALFDAGATGKIPAANNGGCSSFDGSCRNVFTVTQVPSATTGVSTRPPRVQLNDTNSSAIGALIAPASVITGITATHWQTIVRKVIAGGLGGVDRSTVAVIPASPLAGLATRPSIVYFGAADGMLHAVCASTGGVTETDTNVCPSLGTELWAFMPRTQLPLVRKNLARVDGSVRVIDAFGDFSGTGQRGFRTILTFQTGSADLTIGAPGSVYALDVTDPANPTVVWEYTAPTSSPTATELGAGLAIAAGPVLVNNKPMNLVIAQTNNGGTGGTATVATALSLETGVRQWKFGYAFPSPPRNDATALPLPLTGIPGGAVGVDLTKQGFLTDVVMGDLFGNLWRLDAATGASRTGATPLFSFSTNKKPIGAVPAIYSDGNRQFVVFGSGGYADPLLATWAAGTQSLISIPITAAGPFPLDESSAQLAFKENLTAGSRAFAQVLVVGNEVFLATDSADVNLATYGSTTGTSGRVVGYDLTTTSSTVVAVRGGASSLASQGTSLFSSSSDQQQEVSTAANGSVGVSVDSGSLPKLERRLWLRTE